LPLKFAAAAGGIAYDVMLNWRDRDPHFAQALAQAHLESAEKKWIQANVVQNNLTITISAEEAREIEVQAESSRAMVREMYAQYRPSQGNGENS
jgi:hypothetical protein